MKHLLQKIKLVNCVENKILEAEKKLAQHGKNQHLAQYLYKYMDDKTLFDEGIERLIKGEPVQYVIGHVDFYGNKILVDNRVLIPRFETEELIEITINFINKMFDNDNLNIIDLGTGSGCIAITLKKKFHNANVSAVDISLEALEVARGNAKLNEVEINFISNDFLNNIEDKFDIIISNPPYLKESDPVEEIVEDNEPKIALYAEKEGLAAYEVILKNINKNLNDKFIIAFEIGCDEGEKIADMAVKYLDKLNIIIDIHHDNQGRKRFLFIRSNH